MKKTILSMIACGAALSGMAQQMGEFTVKGTMAGLGDSVAVYLIDPMSNKTVLQQNVALPAIDEVDLSLDLTRVGNLYVMRLEDGQPSQAVSFSIPALPGEAATISGTSDSYRVGGTQFYQDYSDATDAIEAPQREYYNFVNECQQMMAQGKSQDEVMAIYEKKGPALQQKIADAAVAYIKAHPDQEASAALVTSAGDDMEATATLLSPRVQNSRVNVLYKGVIEAQKREAEAEARRNALEGKPAPDFTLVDINGRPLSLSQLKGKWVILDFWGSWCKWCIKGMPDMKDYYNTYKGKLEILGVDCNDTMEKWKAAVDNLDLPWKHVYNPGDTDDNPVTTYGVRGFPTKVIIDPQGVVNKVIVGEDPEFYNYLDTLLK